MVRHLHASRTSTRTGGHLSLRLENHHIAITGGSRGIGAAIVDKALAEGARVSFIDLEDELGRQRFAELGAPDRTFFARGDIRLADEIAAFHEGAVAKLGPVTGLVNNAGRTVFADPLAMTEAQWDEFMSVDLKSVWLCARVVLPGMIASGNSAIVNIASVHADTPSPATSPTPQRNPGSWD